MELAAQHHRESGAGSTASQSESSTASQREGSWQHSITERVELAAQHHRESGAGSTASQRKWSWQHSITANDLSGSAAERARAGERGRGREAVMV